MYVGFVSCKLFEMVLLWWFLLGQCLVVFGVFLFLLFGDFGGVCVCVVSLCFWWDVSYGAMVTFDIKVVIRRRWRRET